MYEGNTMVNNMMVTEYTVLLFKNDLKFFEQNMLPELSYQKSINKFPTFRGSSIKVTTFSLIVDLG